MPRWIIAAALAVSLAFGVTAAPVVASESPEPAFAEGDPRHFGPFCFAEHAPGSREQRDAVRGAFVNSTYPWEATLPYVREKRARKDGCIPVAFDRCPGCMGLWGPNAAIVIADGLSPASSARIFLYEAAHFVDYATLRDLGAPFRDDLVRVAHGGEDTPDHGKGHGHCWLGGCNYGDQVGESLMAAFTGSFAPGYFTGLWGSHKLTPEDAGPILLAAAAERDAFTDTDGHTHREAIDRMAGLGIIRGYADGSFRPDEPITRGQAATMLARLLDHVQASQ